MIKGIDIQLWVNGNPVIDEFNHEEPGGEWITISNVLVGEPSSEEVTNELNLSGKHISYVLGIPKGDEHMWIDTKVKLPSPFDGEYSTVGFPTAGIETNIPLLWNKKVKISRYE